MDRRKRVKIIMGHLA